MIISKTPVRISFLGGGSDYPDYYRRCGGATLCTTIDKYTYVTVQRMFPYFDYSLLLSYSRTERVNSVDEIEHPSIRECLKHLDIPRDIEIHTAADLPARTGMGSSSSFTVGLLHALHAYRGELVSKWKLAQEAIHVEQNLIQERVGSQDQCITALGGMRILRFLQNGMIEHEALPIHSSRLEQLEDHLMLFYTRIRRSAHEILEEQIKNTQSGGIDSHLKDLADMVPHAAEILCSGQDMDDFGRLLHEGWQTKQRLSASASTDAINVWYETARGAGAIGGKLLGAGSGGFLLFYVPPDRRAAVRSALSELIEVPFRFEREGSTLLFYNEP